MASGHHWQSYLLHDMQAIRWIIEFSLRRCFGRKSCDRNAIASSSRGNCVPTLRLSENLQKSPCGAILHQVHFLHCVFILDSDSSDAIFPAQSEKCSEFHVSCKKSSERALIWIIDRPVSALLKNVSRIIGISYTVRGEEYLRQERTCVVLINHQSSLDCLGKPEFAQAALSANMFHEWRLIFLLFVDFKGCMVCMLR